MRSRSADHRPRRPPWLFHIANGLQCRRASDAVTCLFRSSPALDWLPTPTLAMRPNHQMFGADPCYQTDHSLRKILAVVGLNACRQENGKAPPFASTCSCHVGPGEGGRGGPPGRGTKPNFMITGSAPPHSRGWSVTDVCPRSPVDLGAALFPPRRGRSYFLAAFHHERIRQDPVRISLGFVVVGGVWGVRVPAVGSAPKFGDVKEAHLDAEGLLATSSARDALDLWHGRRGEIAKRTQSTRKIDA